MTLEQVAASVIDVVETSGVPFMVVQKLRWGRNKDLDDARDVLAVQGPESLDMDYISRWCEIHGTATRLREALDGIPPL